MAFPSLPRYGVLAEPPHLIENGSAFYVWLRLCRAVLSLPSAFHAAQWAIVRPAPPSHNLRHHARWPTAPSPKTNAPPHQIPGTARAASISGCAAIRTPASPNSKSHSGDSPPPAILP